MAKDDIRQRYKKLIVSRVPGGPFIVLRFRATPLEMDPINAALHLLLILTQRTIRPLDYEDATTSDFARLGAAVIPQGPGSAGSAVTLALPLHVCSEREGLTQLVLTATSCAEYGYTSEYWLEDIELPVEVLRWFSGPRLGVEGVRRLLGIHKRPLIGFIVKPRAGATLQAVRSACADALAGGVDLLVDDLLMTDPDGEMAFSSRVPELCSLVKAYNAQLPSTESRVGYLVNIGSSAFRAKKYLAEAVANGATGVIVDCFTMGFGTVHDLVDLAHKELGASECVFVASNMGSGIMGRNPDDEQAGAERAARQYLRTGFSEALTAKLSRLAGVDAVHTGTVGSECFEVHEYSLTHVALREQYHSFRRCFAVAEGDLQLINVAENIRSMGNDVIIETSSGITNHPDGVRAGARAFRALAGTISEDLTSEEVDNVLNILRHKMPEVRAVLQAWLKEKDVLIRKGWSHEVSWKTLSNSGHVSDELQRIYSGKPTWNPRRTV